MTSPETPTTRVFAPKSRSILVALGAGASFETPDGFDFRTLADENAADRPRRATTAILPTASATLESAIAMALAEGYGALVVVAPLVRVDAAASAHLRGWLEAGYDHLSTTAIGLGRSPIAPTLAARLLLAPLLSLAAGTRYTDPGITIRAYSRRLLEDPAIAPIRGTWPKDSLFGYLAIRAPRRGYHAVEIPFATDRRGPFGAGAGFRHWWRLLTYAYDPGATHRK